MTSDREEKNLFQTLRRSKNRIRDNMPKDNLPNMEDKLRKVIRQIVPDPIFGILSFGKLPRIRISVGKQTLSNKYLNDLKQDFVALNAL